MIKIPIKISGLLNGETIIVSIPCLDKTFDIEKEIASETNLMQFITTKVQDEIISSSIAVQLLTNHNTVSKTPARTLADEICTEVFIDSNILSTDLRRTCFSEKCLPGTALFLRIVSDLMFTVMGYFALEVSMKEWSLEPGKAMVAGFLSVCSFSMAMVMYIYSDASRSAREFAKGIESRFKRKALLSTNGLQQKEYTTCGTAILYGTITVLTMLTITDSLLLSISGAESMYVLGKERNDENKADMSTSLLAMLSVSIFISTFISRLAFDGSFSVQAYGQVKKYVDSKHIFFKSQAIGQTESMNLLQRAIDFSVSHG